MTLDEYVGSFKGKRVDRGVNMGGRLNRLGTLQYAHSDAVDAALQLGKPVPEAVRAEYPDLQRKYAGLFAREASPAGLTVAQINDSLQPLLAKWTNAPPVEVIASMAEAPEAVRSQDEGARSQGATGAPQAFFYQGKAYLVASSIESPEAARRALFHEVLGHAGLRGTYGARLDPILDRVAFDFKDRVNAKASEYGLDVKNVEERRQAAEEVLAELAQSRPTLGVVQRLIAAIRQFLREVGIDLKLSDADLIANFIAPARDFVERGRMGVRGQLSTVFHRAYHGSPHVFDKFQSSKINSGEGAQVYGWGLYFAGRKQVAEHYRTKLAGEPKMRKVMIDGVSEEQFYSNHPQAEDLIDESPASKDQIGLGLQHIVYYVRLYKDAAKGLAEAKRVAYAIADKNPEAAAAKAIFDNHQVEVEPDRIPGRLYEVELAPKEDDYLDWDKPLAQQSAKVRAAISRVRRNLPKDVMTAEHFGYDLTDFRALPEEKKRDLIARTPKSNWLGSVGAARIYYDLAKMLGGPVGENHPGWMRDMGVTAPNEEGASKALLAAGIPGIKYLDQGSRGAGDGTHNYVIFDDKLVKIEAAFSRAATIPAWVQAQPAETREALRKAGIWHQPPTLKQRVAEWSKDWQARVRQGLVDQFDPIKKYDYRAYMHARMTKGADAALEGVLMNGTIYLDKDGAVDVRYEKGGFLGILSKLNNEHDRFFAWVIGNRAERLMSEGREHNFTAADIARLKGLNQGTMKGGGSRFAAYERALTALNRYNRSVLDMAEQAGLIDPDSRSAWEKDFYVPFYRMMEEERVKGPVISKGLVRQYAFKTLKGGEQAIGDPLENVLRNWSHLIDASLKNQAAKESVLAAADVGAATEAPEETARQMAKSVGKKDAVIHFMDQGTPRYFVIDDPFLLDAIQSIGFTGFQGVGMQIMGKVKRWLTYGVTISPTFRVRNIIRDSLTMIGTNQANYNVLDNIVTGWQMTKEGDPFYASLIAGGGVMRYGTALEGDRAQHVKRLIEAGIKDSSVLDTPEKVKEMLSQAWDWWMHVGDRSENLNRAALYNTLRKEGKSHLEASFAARDTMDFSMQGTWAAIRFLAQTVPFFNARLQGLYKLGRGALEDPQRFAYVAGGVAMASMALLLAYKDDDDWKRREDFDRETFWWFKLGDKAFRIPKPFEIGAIGTLAERALEAMITNELTGKQFAERIGSIISQQLSMNPVPQLLKPMIEAWANRDSFTDRPIESMGMERLSRAERIGPSTSAVAQLAGKAGLVSPVQIDHLINGYFGWLGTHIVATADLALRPAMGLGGKPAARIDEVLLAGDFVKDLPAYQSKYVTHLYDQAKRVQESFADYRHAQQLGDTAKAASIMQGEGENIRLARLYTAAEAQLTKVNTQIKIVQAGHDDAEMKRRKLDGLYAIRNSIAQVTDARAKALRQ